MITVTDKPSGPGALGERFFVERDGDRVGLQWRFFVKQASVTRAQAREIAWALLAASEDND